MNEMKKVRKFAINYIVEEDITFEEACNKYNISNNWDKKNDIKVKGYVLTDKKIKWFISNEFFKNNYELVE